MTSAEGIARKRISSTPKLAALEDVIFADWPNWNEHINWLNTASAEEIYDWASSIESDGE